METRLRLVQSLCKSENRRGIPYLLCDKHYEEDRAAKIRQGFDDLVIIRDRESYLIDGDGYYFPPPHAKCCMCRSMNNYKADISIRRIGVTTAPKIPWDHPAVRYSSCLHHEVFKAADITQARQSAIDLIENPNRPEFQKVLDSYFVPFKTLEWGNWQDPDQPEGETRIYSCSSHPFLVDVFQWIVTILVYEV